MRAMTALALVLAATMTACGDSTTGPSGSSRLTVMLKDSPFTDARSLLVTFSDVSVHQTEGEWATVPFAGGASSRTCDLKKLTAAQDVLGTGALTPGRYTMVRLTVSSAVLYFDNVAPEPPCAPTIAPPAGRSALVDIPSGVVRLNRPFDVADGGGTTMLLDFDGDRAVRETGNGRDRMAPVITIVSVQ